LVKVTRAGSDLSREGMAFRLERLESGAGAHAATPTPASDTVSLGQAPAVAEAAEPAAPPSLELEQLQEAWRRSVLPAVEERSIPTAAMLTEAHPARLAGDTLTLEFPPAASFHRQKAEEP